MAKFETYQQEELTIDLKQMQLRSIYYLFAAVIFFAIPFYLIWHNQINLKHLTIFDGKSNTIFISKKPLSLIGSVVILIIVHELIHGLTWAWLGGTGFKSVRFGVAWKYLTPYCHYKFPLKAKHYIIGAMMPALILGFIPEVIALIAGNQTLFFWGFFGIVTAAGDFMIISLIRKQSFQCLVQDHPSKPGCIIYRLHD